MKKSMSIVALLTLASLVLLPLGNVAAADEMKMVGVITKIDCPGNDAKAATVCLKDNKTGELVTVTVTDDLTLDKLKDHRIVEGDEIRCKYEVKDGKCHSKYFRKTAGC
jgi:hypothetical protein